MKDYSDFGPAYSGFKVKDYVYVPEPAAHFSGENPYVRMAPVRGPLKDIDFDENYKFLDKSLKFKLLSFLLYLAACIVALPLNWIRYGVRVEGRDRLRKNRKLLSNGFLTVSNHVSRWDMITVLHALRFRRARIPMYSLPFRGKDHFVMKYIGGLPIPENRGGLRKFNNTLDEISGQGKWIHIFPESCSWKFYSPLRPFKTGSFNIAYKYDYPVVPLMISFRPRTGWRRLFCKDEPLVTVHVGNPIIPDKNSPRKADVIRMCTETHRSMLDMAGIVSNPWPAYIE